MLYREPKLLKGSVWTTAVRSVWVSVLYREPKLLKAVLPDLGDVPARGFSALP